MARRCTCGASDGLTDTEIRIIVDLANGLDITDIATQLHHTASTIATYVSRARGKLHARNRAHLIARAFTRGLIKVDAHENVVLAHPLSRAS